MTEGTSKCLIPVLVDEPVEADIVPPGAATASAVLSRDEVQAKLAMLFATLEGLSEEQLAALHDARIDQQADEIAGMVAYLAGPEAAFVTGASLAIDGGYTA